MSRYGRSRRDRLGFEEGPIDACVHDPHPALDVEVKLAVLFEDLRERLLPIAALPEVTDGSVLTLHGNLREAWIGRCDRGAHAGFAWPMPHRLQVRTRRLPSFFHALNQ